MLPICGNSFTYFEVLNTDINEDTQIIIKGKSLVKPGQTVGPILKREKL